MNRKSFYNCLLWCYAMASFWMAAYWLWWSKKNTSHFADFRAVKIFNKTTLGKTGCLFNPFFLLTGCLGILFFDSTVLFLIHSNDLPLINYASLCSTCVTYRALCHSIGHQLFSTQTIPREAENFPRGRKDS